MPLFHYYCNDCAKEVRKILVKANVQKCPTCTHTMARRPTPVTSTTKEVIDNGIMSKSVETIVDAQEIYKERARQDAIDNRDSFMVGVRNEDD